MATSVNDKMTRCLVSSCHLVSPYRALDRPRRRGPANVPAWPAVLVLLCGEPLILPCERLHHDLARGIVELRERGEQLRGGVGREPGEVIGVDLLVGAQCLCLRRAEPADVLAHNQRIGIGGIQNGQVHQRRGECAECEHLWLFAQQRQQKQRKYQRQPDHKTVSINSQLGVAICLLVEQHTLKAETSNPSTRAIIAAQAAPNARRCRISARRVTTASAQSRPSDRHATASSSKKPRRAYSE